MNAAIVLLVVCAAAVEVLAGPHGHPGEKMRKNMEECLATTGADMESIKAAKSGEPVTDENVKCFFACFSKKTGSMNEDGTVNKDKLKQMGAHMSEGQGEEMKQTLDKCAEITGENECDTGYRLFECMRPLMKHRHRKHGRD